MKPVLLIGLGNPMSPIDGVGSRVARVLAQSPPKGIEVVEGGTDLLRLTNAMLGREHVILVDAMAGTETPGRVDVFEGSFDGLEEASGSAHALSAVGALKLLLTAESGLRTTRFTLITIGVGPGTPDRRLLRTAARVRGIVQEMCAEAGSDVDRKEGQGP